MIKFLVQRKALNVLSINTTKSIHRTYIRSFAELRSHSFEEKEKIACGLSPETKIIYQQTYNFKTCALLLMSIGHTIVSSYYVYDLIYPKVLEFEKNTLTNILVCISLLILYFFRLILICLL